MNRITFIYLISCFLILGCKEKIEISEKPADKVEPIAVILFSVGEVSASGKKIKSGDSIFTKDVLKVGKKSFADVQILDQEITFRAKELTEISLTSFLKGGKLELVSKVGIGTALFNVQKLKQNEGFKVVSPTVVMAVRGTRFEANVSQNGTTSTSVLEGKVATRVQIPELENLTEQDIAKSATLTKLSETLNSQELVLEKGQSTTCDISTPKKILQDAGLEKAVQNLKPDSIASVDKEVSAEDVSKKLAAKSTSLSPKNISASDLQKKLGEYNELVSVELAKLSDPNQRVASIAERNKKANDVILNRISEIMGQAPETLILLNGERVRGIIVQERGKYIVLTPSGQKEYDAKDIDSTEF